MTIFGSLVMRFANDFHSWLRHSWKSSANRLTRDPKIVIHGNSCIILYFLNENVWISIQVSLKFVRGGPINNIPALVQIMAWCRPGDKPLSEPMMVSLLTHICVTRPQWVKVIFYHKRRVTGLLLYDTVYRYWTPSGYLKTTMKYSNAQELIEEQNEELMKSVRLFDTE